MISEFINEDVCNKLNIPFGIDLNDLESRPTSPKSEASGYNRWPEPEPVEIPLPKVQPLTPVMIPKPLREWLADISTRMSCPIDFVAVTALIMASTVIGSRCRIQPLRFDDWKVTPNLWGAIIAEPGEMKSPAISRVMKILIPLEMEAKERHKEECLNFVVDEEILKAEFEKIRKEVKKNPKQVTAEQRDRLKEIKEELQEATPKLKRFKTNDVTVEKLADLCGENPDGLLVFKDELTGLLKSWEKQGHEPARAFYLEAWNGDSGYTVDRVMKGSTFIKTLCVSLFGGIQPDKLKGYLNQLENGENDGMVQRLQLMVYPDSMKYVRPKQWPNQGEYDNALELYRRLANMDFKIAGANQNDFDKVPYFKFSDEAQTIFDNWIDKLQNETLQSDEISKFLKQHLTKYRSLVPSLALIFHSLDCAVSKLNFGDIKSKTIELAIQWSEYFFSHAERVYNGLGNPVDNGAIQLSKNIKRGKLESPFSARDVYRKNWHLLNDKKRVQRAIDLLIEFGWLEPFTSEAPEIGRTPAPRYVINPKIKIE